MGGIVPVHSRTITNEAIEVLQRYDWPGNMRELKDVLVAAAQGTERTVTSANLTLPSARASVFLREDEDIVPLAKVDISSGLLKLFRVREANWLRSWECRSVRSTGCTHKAKTPQGNSLVLIQTQWQNALFGDFEIDL